MENTIQDIERLQEAFKGCQKLFTALGDETRQYLLCMMLLGECRGSRVIEMAEKTSLSRPAISHHMQILKDAGIVKSRKEGTLIYYYLDPKDSEMEKMMNLLMDIKKIMQGVPDRSGEDD